MDSRRKEEKKTTTFVFFPLVLGLAATAAYFIWGRKPPPETIQLNGKVTSQQTDAPLDNVRVELDNGLFQYTNEDGIYLFENMEVGTYMIYFTKDTYDPISGEVSIIAGENVLNVALSPIIWEMPEYELTYIEEWSYLGDVSDWDQYIVGGQGAYWELDPGNYKSAPSSLAIIAPATGEDFLLISKRPEAQNLQQGRIASWVWGYTSIFPWPDFIEGFVYGFKNKDNFRFIKWEMGGWWRKYRLSWWNDIDYQNQPKLHVLFEYYNENTYEWTKIDEFYEERLSGDINRIGIYFSNHYSAGFPGECRFDDTELYRVKVS